MLSWYRNRIEEHGLSAATQLLVRVVWTRSFVLLSNRFLAATVECPCCNWTGRRFFDYIEVGYSVPNAACPNCDSHSRQRALSLWLRNEFRLGEKKGVALVLAPERSLDPLWNGATHLRVIRIDIEPARGVDLLGDVMRLPLAERSVDLIWCHHVLEQVPDDQLAMREMYRLLSSSGVLVISAGMDATEETREFGFSDKTLSGNRRRYGRDFSKRLQAAGFIVTPLSYDLSERELKLYGIYPEPFFFCVRPDQDSVLPAA